MRSRFEIKCIAAFLAVWMAFTEFVPVTVYAENIESAKNGTVSQQTNEVQQETKPNASEDKATVPEETLLPVYQNQTILIYTYAQLLQIGSGAAVTDTDAETDQLGKGQPVINEDGKPVTYSLDAQYTIVQDIPLPANSVWQLPRDFTGGIAPQEQEDVSLYQADSDTIYVTNPYQLAVMASDTAETEPVMSGDTKVSTFGMGQLIYPQGDENTYLTYSSSHKYVLSKQFDSDTTDGTTSIVSNTEADGRDFAGQVVKTIGKKTYILIGNEQQLRAIGSDETVYGAVYQAKYHNAKWHVDADEDGNPIMLYGGDADIEKQYNGTKDYTFGEKGIEKADGALTGRCGVNQTTGEIDPNLDIDKATNEKYSSDANYIIFRDIDLSSANWTPLMFQGTMLGAKASGTSTLWDDAGISTAAARPILSHITVDQTENVEVSKLMGIGFFGTISSEASADDIGLSKGLVEVLHLELSDISVSNTAQKAYADQTLVSGLLSTVGGLVGGIVDLLLWVLTIGQVKLNVRTLLSDLLNARAADKTALATGAFAGRVIGEVKISDCTVTQASVKSNHEYVGGFVGYTEGRTEYSGLSQALGTVVKTLSAILNVIPGLGLGDLITILLQNALPVGNLIPSDYKNAKIENCTVSQLNRLETQDDKERIGGFIGQQTGSWIQNCAITNSSYTVKGSQYVGGFVGLARDGEIKGTLTEGLNIDIEHFGLPASLLYQCAIQNSAYSVSGTSYVGGFSGAQAYTDAVNCSIDTGDNTLSISGSGDCVGGFAGIATIGWLTNLGKDEVQDASLLKVVTSLLVSLLGDNKVGNVALLSLVGVAPSSVSGCQITASGLTVRAGGDYAGGLIGKGDASYLTDSSKDQLDQLEFWKRGILTDYPEVRKSSVVNLQTVQGKNFVGGAAGSVGTASVAGLLNSAVGAGSFLGFTVSDVSISGDSAGYTVMASENDAGGVFGAAIGGTITNVSADHLQAVTADNEAAGFIALAGTGALVTTGGLTVNLLGLNYLLKVSNLLSIGQGLQVVMKDSKVTGIDSGYTVQTTGQRTEDSVTEYTAGGFVARGHSVSMQNCHADQVGSVTATDNGGYAGGFVAVSKTGGLADVASEQDLSLIKVDGLLTAIAYLIPKYTDCTVSYAQAQNAGTVRADYAGGFTADFQSGTVNNESRGETDAYAVYHLQSVVGQSYAGGFGGRVYSGALADAGKGISVLGGSGLSINISDLLRVINAYVPYIQYAGVQSSGFTVQAKKVTDEPTVGSAGGLIGYASGAQISHSDVTKLKNTAVSEKAYYDSSSQYAVTGGRYAGGYIGNMDIGSAASVGGGLKVLGNSLQLTGILDALSVVVTTVEHSQVTGATGGFAVQATGSKDNGYVGMAGGFVGGLYGGHIQNSHANNFSYIVGRITAGGYAGEMQPGDVAKVLDNASVLGNLVNVDETLASLLQDFVPTIRNSTTDCIPCGGVVEADAASDDTVSRGMAGGYVGHNMGGQILGLNTSRWKNQATYSGQTSLCSAERIRTVHGTEYAGGYAGRMECSDTARVGGLKILGGLIQVNNILGALGVIYPKQTNTAIYGPLANLDKDTWNAWVEHVGKYGGYGKELAKAGTVQTDAELQQKLSQYTYGYEVTADSSESDAGGYIGLMSSGTLTNCMAYDAKKVTAKHAAGGYAGQMKTGGAAELGNVNILGLKLDAGKLLNIAQLFVPAVKNSSVQGYDSGLTVTATGSGNKTGYAGGYVGCAYGAQIQLNGKDLPSSWGSSTAPTASCDALNLRRVAGRKSVGGYVGLASAASVADVNTKEVSNGLLQGILDGLIDTSGDLVKVLDATVTTIHRANVSAADPTWGFVVTGAYQDSSGKIDYALEAGGFAGSLEAAVIGEQKTADSITITNLRRVDGGEYAGGFFGLADVGGVADVGNSDKTNVLSGLIKLGNISVLDAFRTYIYQSSVQGISEGMDVQAHDATSSGTQSETRYSGCAGGFGGGMMDGSIKNCTVSAVATIEGVNYTGGFVGHLGKSGVADIDDADVLSKLLADANVGALDLFGAHVEDCTVDGFSLGTVIHAKDGKQPIAGGFVGYGDLAQIKNCTVQKLKQVTSEQIAGGFIGKTDMNYIVSAEVQSKLLNAVLSIVNQLLKMLYVDKIEDLGLINVNLGPILQLQVAKDGNLLYVDLLGLRISVGLSKAADSGKATDVAIVTIGDSTIELPCTEDGVSDSSNLKINLIKGNRTVVTDSSVSGIAVGYDVYGGGAGNQADGTNKNGITGGFVGLNHEGKLENDTMTRCDVVRGTEDNVGPFTGLNDLKSVYTFNTIQSIEGKGNTYSIYRADNAALTKAETAGNTTFSSRQEDDTTGKPLNRYLVNHLEKITGLADLKDAKLANDDNSETEDLNAYASAAKAVLMQDTATADNPEHQTPEPGEQADPCVGTGQTTVNYTIQKIWKDFSNIDGIRPDSIELKIYQQAYDADGTSRGEKTLWKTITLTTADKEAGRAATWRKVLQDVPVSEYTVDETTGEKTITAYYTYTVEESPVSGYTTSDTSYREEKYQATITNTHHPTLPITGNAGDWWFVILGVGILLFGLAMRKRRKAHLKEGNENQD